MTKDEALKLALDFVASISPAFICEATHHKKNERHTANEPCPHVEKQKATYEAIKEALMSHSDGAQPSVSVEQEPVAWISSEELLVMRGNALGGAKDWRINVGLVKQENDVGLYTTPPQRPSRSDIKPLTDEETYKIQTSVGYSGGFSRFVGIVRAIEAAHSIKG